jgi:hypothetical protein
MSFQPIVPFGGFVGWQFLQRSMESQREAFDASPVRQREIDYFRENIGSVSSPEDLVNDRRLRAVALGAFGLDDDIDSKAFIRKVLEEGVADPRSLANRLSDSRYRAFSEAFGFGNGLPPNTIRPDFGTEIAEAYLARQFEVGVGQSDPSLRLALGLGRELPQIAERSSSNDTKWLTVMGNRPLREVFETALGLPDSFGALDIDRQLAEFKDRAGRFLGVSDFSDFTDPGKRDELLRLYLVRAQLEGSAGGARVSSPALTLLRGASAPGLLSLL